MPFLPAQRISEPAKVSFRGTALATRGDITNKSVRSTLDIPLSNGRKRKMITETGYLITVPVLAAFSTLLPWYADWAKVAYGEAVAPRGIKVTALDATANTFTSVAHGLVDNDTVQIHFDCAAPASTPTLSRSETYTVDQIDADTFKLTTTSGTPTLVDITSATLNGGLWVRKQDTLILSQQDSTVTTFLNVVPVELPDLVFSGNALQWEGNLVFRAFPKLGATVADGTAAFYTSSNSGWTAPTWAGTEDLTISDMTATWASGRTTTLETSFRCEKGLRVSFKPGLGMIDDGIFPNASAFLQSFDVSAKGVPIGMTTAEWAAEFGPSLGTQITGANLVLTGTGLSLTLYDAQLIADGMQEFGTSKPLIPELTWEAMGNSTSGGKPPFLLVAA